MLIKVHLFHLSGYFNLAVMNCNLHCQVKEIETIDKIVVAKEIAFISQESVEMFEELVEISDDELNTMEELVQ